MTAAGAANPGTRPEPPAASRHAHSFSFTRHGCSWPAVLKEIFSGSGQSIWHQERAAGRLAQRPRLLGLPITMLDQAATESGGTKSCALQLRSSMRILQWLGPTGMTCYSPTTLTVAAPARSPGPKPPAKPPAKPASPPCAATGPSGTGHSQPMATMAGARPSGMLPPESCPEKGVPAFQHPVLSRTVNCQRQARPCGREYPHTHRLADKRAPRSQETCLDLPYLSPRQLQQGGGVASCCHVGGCRRNDGRCCDGSTDGGSAHSGGLPTVSRRRRHGLPPRPDGPAAQSAYPS